MRINPLGVLGLMALLCVGTLFYSSYSNDGWLGVSITTVLLIALVVYCFIKVANPCKCGRTRPWYYDRSHPIPFFMVLQFFYFAGFAGWDLYAFFTEGSGWELVAALGMGTAAIWHLRWLYLHEKDRLKRLLKKVSGVVRVNHHGRLAVVPT